MNRFAFADYVVTVKPIPNVKRGSVVRVTSFVVVKGRLFYSTVLESEDGTLIDVQIVPDNALGFHRSPTPAEAQDLMKGLSK